MCDRLFVHAVAPSEEDWQKYRQHPKLDRWHKYMAKLLVTDDTSQSVVELGEEAFMFGMFKS